MQPSRHFAVLFADLERHTDAWLRVPRERMVAAIGEYRYIAESLASQYGAFYREWAGDGHMFLFESADAAAQFGLKLLDSWSIATAESNALRGLPELALRLGCHFGECTRLDGDEAWIGRGNAVAKRVESQAPPGTLLVTESILELIDLPLYTFLEAGAYELKGDIIPRRLLYRLASFDEAAFARKPDAELTAEDWFLRGVALVGTEREWSDEEADCYRNALELRPDHVEAHVNLAILLNARGDAAGAGRHYGEALRLNPESAEAHFNYAVHLGARGRVAGAAQHFAEALRIRPGHVDAHHAFANLLAAQNDIAEAAGHYEAALELRPDDAVVLADYATMLDRAGDSAGAMRRYQESLRIRPDPTVHYNYALLLEELGEEGLAELHYGEALRLWPDYGEAHNNLAILLQARGDLEGAEAHYLAALEARPEDPEAHYNYALLLRGRGDEEQARRHVRIAHELAPDVLIFRSALDRSTPP